MHASQKHTHISSNVIIILLYRKNRKRVHNSTVQVWVEFKKYSYKINQVSTLLPKIWDFGLCMVLKPAISVLS